MEARIITRINNVDIAGIGPDNLIPILHLANAIGVDAIELINQLERDGLENKVGLCTAEYEGEYYTCIPGKLAILCIPPDIWSMTAAERAYKVIAFLSGLSILELIGLKS